MWGVMNVWMGMRISDWVRKLTRLVTACRRKGEETGKVIKIWSELTRVFERQATASLRCVKPSGYR